VELQEWPVVWNLLLLDYLAFRSRGKVISNSSTLGSLLLCLFFFALPDLLLDFFREIANMVSFLVLLLCRLSLLL